MTDLRDDSEVIDDTDSEPAIAEDSADALFGDYSVLSPGVQIVLGGRPVSAPAR